MIQDWNLQIIMIEARPHQGCEMNANRAIRCARPAWIMNHLLQLDSYSSPGVTAASCYFAYTKTLTRAKRIEAEKLIRCTTNVR